MRNYWVLLAWCPNILYHQTFLWSPQLSVWAHPRECVMVMVIGAPHGMPQTPEKSLNIMCLCMRSINDHQVCIELATTSPKKVLKGCHLVFRS